VTVARAATLLDVGRPEEALRVLAALGDDAGTGQAHCLRALAYLRLERFDEAAASAAQARAVDPSWEWGYRLGSIAAIRSGRLREAVALADEAVRVAPDEELTHYVAAWAYLQVRNLPVARQHSEQMLKLSPGNPLSHQTQGRVLLAQQLLPEAEAELRAALALNPHDAESMSLLAHVSAGLGKSEEATDLHLAAVRADPQNTSRQRNLLRKGGAGTAGAVAVGSKLGVLKAVAALNLARVFGAAATTTGETVAAFAAAVTLAVCFAVSRVRRRRHGRDLPPLVWEGLRSARRNSDLRWLAWPAALVAAVSAASVVGGLASGAAVGPRLVLLAAAIAVLGLCWRLRAGEARLTTLGDLLRQASRTRRFVLERGLVRHARGPQSATVWTRAQSPTGNDRYPRAALLIAIAVACGALVGATFGVAAIFVGALVAAMVLGAVFDRADHMRSLVCIRVVRVGSLEAVSRGRLAVRAGLRLVLLPLILVEVVFAGRRPHRFLHDRLTGTERVGLRPEGRLVTQGTEAL